MQLVLKTQTGNHYVHSKHLVAFYILWSCSVNQQHYGCLWSNMAARATTSQRSQQKSTFTMANPPSILILLGWRDFCLVECANLTTVSNWTFLCVGSSISRSRLLSAAITLRNECDFNCGALVESQVLFIWIIIVIELRVGKSVPFIRFQQSLTFIEYWSFSHWLNLLV